MREWWGDCGQFHYAVFKARGCSQIVSRKFFFKKSEAGRKKKNFVFKDCQQSITQIIHKAYHPTLS